AMMSERVILLLPEEDETKTLRKFIAGWSLLYFITEVPLAWDLILDSPYIPASEIKGILRDHFMELTNNGVLTDCVFGSKGGVGKVIFLDAYPIEAPQNSILTYDIINPHYGRAKDEYDVQPVPVKFLAINEGVKFKTFIAFDKEVLEECKSNLKESVTITLLRALILSMKSGWGRRTSRGYGDLELLEVNQTCP
ncbi:type III-B CRISPR module RAMP protein Cmr6, partial [Sulfolobus sp. E3]